LRINLKNIIVWAIVLLFQLLVFNELNVSGYINPYIYPLLIILLPFDIAGWLLLLIAAVLGLLIDLFTGTLGMHMFALVFMAAIRPALARTLSLDRNDSGSQINLKQHGWVVVISFVGVLLFVHHFAYFLLETFASSGFAYALTRTFLSAFFSILLSFILLLFLNSFQNER
jgi:hypothetical protein